MTKFESNCVEISCVLSLNELRVITLALRSLIEDSVTHEEWRSQAIALLNELLKRYEAEFRIT